MPIFHFHLHNDDDVPDLGGKELPDLESARAHAVEMARFEVAESVKRQGRIVLSHRIDIEDEEGNVLGTVRFDEVVEIVPRPR